ncbi:hypothetical protein O7634_22005 [Micromonospora sp. WMMD1120]|uniref:hypothetical protein n=1 Tax=Micromonospora sp. WMMD1120 TaxID=3016106 RepID=UPI002416AEEB|nr:hypothetical protein [Micromonospora sp. WMMD1120]MDG4809430.1 hypothetical protein [Micromonospora sp. WMMD1120]
MVLTEFGAEAVERRREMVLLHLLGVTRRQIRAIIQRQQPAIRLRHQLHRPAHSHV